MVEASFFVRFCSASSRQICKLRLSSSRVSRFSSSRPSWYSSSACWIRTSMLLRHVHCLVLNYSRDRDYMFTIPVLSGVLWLALTGRKTKRYPQPYATGYQKSASLAAWIFFGNRRLFRLIHVSRTKDGKFANTGHTSRLVQKLLERPSKTWFKNMFMLVLLFLEIMPKLKLC